MSDQADAGRDEATRPGPAPEDLQAMAAAAGERFEDLAEAALELEVATGHREATAEEAKRGLLKRVAIIVAGSFVLLLGILLLALPGPGLLVVVIGLGLLASEVPFAARLLEKAKKRLPQDEDGKLPKSTIVMMVAICVVFTGASLYWSLVIRG